MAKEIGPTFAPPLPFMSAQHPFRSQNGPHSGTQPSSPAPPSEPTMVPIEQYESQKRKSDVFEQDNAKPIFCQGTTVLCLFYFSLLANVTDLPRYV